MLQITNGQRPATKQRDTDRIVSRQTQTNIRNLKISNPYTKATQNNTQNKNKYGQSIQNNKKTNAKQRENQKQTQANPQITNNNQNSPENYKITHNSTLQAMFKKSSPGKGFQKTTSNVIKT